MASPRPIQLVNDYTYHVFNRGVERRQLFLNNKEYQRFVDLIDYYRFENVPMSFSHYVNLPKDQHISVLEKLHKSPAAIDILAYCLMPNHFHLITTQKSDHGITRTLANVSNGYAKYFNKKHKRVGPLYQGAFRAIRIETEDQLVHISRYIHINPVVSGIIAESQLETYPWSSLPEYLGTSSRAITSTEYVMADFSTQSNYKKFIHDQISYAKELEKIKHLAMEDV